MSPQLNDGNIRKGLRSLRALTQHLTTRAYLRGDLPGGQGEALSSEVLRPDWPGRAVHSAVTGVAAP